MFSIGIIVLTSLVPMTVQCVARHDLMQCIYKDEDEEKADIDHGVTFWCQPWF